MHHGDMDSDGNVMIFKEGMHGRDVTIDVEIDSTDGEKVVVIKK